MEHNPLHDGIRIEPTPGPCMLVIFGASGDLTRRKLLPAVYHLARAHRLPARFSVLGVAKSPLTDERFQQQFTDGLQEFARTDDVDDGVAASLATQLRYLAGDLDDPALYTKLSGAIAEIAPDGGV